MGLFARQPQAGPSIQYYTIGQQKMALIVGLGNIGPEYDRTRHNVGFLCTDAFVKSQGAMSDWAEKKDLRCMLSKGQLGDIQVIAIKPTTFMNLSGQAVQAVSHFYKIALENIVVIHDELDIPFGQIRLRIGGSSAGHNGIKSVSNAIGENYGRIRIGVGPKTPPGIDSADFVLQKFTKDEQSQLTNLARETNAILTEYLFSRELRHETHSFIA